MCTRAMCEADSRCAKAAEKYAAHEGGVGGAFAEKRRGRMAIRMIVSDLDGTLLDSVYRLSAEQSI